MFPTDRNTTVTRTTSVSNDGKNFVDKISTVEDRHSVVIQLNLHIIDKYRSSKFKAVLLSVFCRTSTIDKLSDDNLILRNGISYSMKKEVIKVVDSPYLIFKFDRLRHSRSGTIQFISAGIIPDQNIYLPPVSGAFIRRLTLNAIVCWKEGHYVCYFKLGLVWYLFNDIDDKNYIQPVGGYIDMLNRKDWSIVSNGVLYFYADTTGSV
jgi:hypothetical protein